MPALTELAVRNLKPASRSYKKYDTLGLYVDIQPSGRRRWRFRYSFAGKANTISLGLYPEVGLKDARTRRDAARQQLAAGVDPSAHRKQLKLIAIEAHGNSFEVIARRWHAKRADTQAEASSKKFFSIFERHVFPRLGARPISQIGAPELLKVLQHIEDSGAKETAHRARQTCGQIFRYGIAAGICDRDVSADLRGALSPVVVKHHASVTTPAEVGELLEMLDGYHGQSTTTAALRLSPFVFVRPGELRKAEWSEFDLEGREWRIPGNKMKGKVQHIVPLAAQAVKILNDLGTLTGGGKYLFPSLRSAARPMSENTINAAMRRLGIPKEKMTGHGFRSMASTLLHEQGWTHQAIECQLAHKDPNAVSAAYNYAEYLPLRKKMMQAWADALDEMKKSNTLPTAVIAEAA